MSDIHIYQYIKSLLSEPEELQEILFEAHISTVPERQHASGIVAAWRKAKANQTFARGQYRNAIAEYEAAIRTVVKDQYELLFPPY